MLWQGDNVETVRVFSASIMIFSAKKPFRTKNDKRKKIKTP